VAAGPGSRRVRSSTVRPASGAVIACPPQRNVGHRFAAASQVHWTTLALCARDERFGAAVRAHRAPLALRAVPPRGSERFGSAVRAHASASSSSCSCSQRASSDSTCGASSPRRFQYLRHFVLAAGVIKGRVGELRVEFAQLVTDLRQLCFGPLQLVLQRLAGRREPLPFRRRLLALLAPRAGRSLVGVGAFPAAREHQRRVVVEIAVEGGRPGRRAPARAGSPLRAAGGGRATRGSARPRRRTAQPSAPRASPCRGGWSARRAPARWAASTRSARARSAPFSPPDIGPISDVAISPEKR